MTLKVGDVVVYTPPGHEPITDETPRWVVLGPYHDGTEDYVWIAEANPKRGRGIAVPTPELVSDLTKAEVP